MKYNEILFKDIARLKIQKGVNKISNAVKITLGPKGKNVILERKNNFPLITKDGVTVAKEIDLINQFENIGAQLIKEVAIKANEIVGDGTTTVTVLAQMLINEGIKYIISGINPIDLKNGINFVINQAIIELEKMSILCQNNDTITHVATISSNSDENIGKLIAKAVNIVGYNSIITVEEGTSFIDELKITEGMQFDRGYLSHYFVNNTENDTVEYEDVIILIINSKISNIKEIIIFLEEIAKLCKPVLIIADDYDSEVITSLVINNMKNILKVVAVKSPSFGINRKEILTDIAIISDGQILSLENNLDLKEINISNLGKAKKIVVSKHDTTIFGGYGNQKKINIQINKIKNQIKIQNNNYDKLILNERLSKLCNGIAVIKVGAVTETELKEKKSRIEDALHAVNAAIDEGIVPGGGVALLRISNKLNYLNDSNHDKNIGIQLTLKALCEPFKQILLNAAMDISVIENNIKSQNNDFFGYDVLNNKYGNMLELGIVDPLKITKYVLKLASSIACLIISTDCMIITKSKQELINQNNEIEN